jgi:hypothetical protein
MRVNSAMSRSRVAAVINSAWTPATWSTPTSRHNRSIWVACAMPMSPARNASAITGRCDSRRAIFARSAA